MNRAYRIDAAGRLHYVAQRRRTDSRAEMNDLVGLLHWALVAVVVWSVLFVRVIWA